MKHFLITLHILFITFLVSSISISAQTRRITGDFFAGGTFSSMDLGEGMNNFKKAKIGFQLGLNINYKLVSMFEIQSGFYLIKKGSIRHVKYSQTNAAGYLEYEDTKTTIDANYIQVPLNIGLQIPLTQYISVTMHGGFYGAYGFKGKTKYSSVVSNSIGDLVTQNIPEHDTFSNEGLKRFDYGLNANIGLVLDIYYIQLQYDLGLANVSAVAGKTMKTRNMALSLGFRF